VSSVNLAHERPGVAQALTRFLDGVGDLRQLELLRIAIGPIVILHLWPFLQRSLDGIAYSDRFFQPYVSWYPEASREVYFVLLWLAVVSAVALSAGAATRLAAVYTAAFVAYNLFLSQLNFVHNRAFLCLLLVGLTLVPVGRRFSVDSLLRCRAGAPNLGSEGRLWPILLLRFEIVCVFVLSGLSKLIDPDWWGGTVIMLRFVDGRAEAEASGVPVWLLDVVVTDGFNSAFAKLAVLTELAIGIGLIFKRTRLGALWLEVGFHVAIEVVFSVQVFSYAALAAMVIWITPSARDRLVIVCGDARRTRLARVAVRWLDWTGRFVVSEGEPNGRPLTLVDRDGRSSSGRTAGLFVLTRLPVLFPFVAPLYGAELLAARLRRRRRPRAAAGDE
jgi:uncharacterized membrane protein YphA (DoxX/SURF4 family)